MSDLGRFVGLGRVIAGGRGMLDASVVRSFVALLGCSPVALCGSFMMVRGGDVRIFWQGGTTFRGRDGLRERRIGS